MHRVLIAGLPGRIASWLAERLPGATVEVSWSGDDVLDQLRTGGFSLVVLDSTVEGMGVEPLVRRIRERPETAALPVFVAMDGGAEPDQMHRLVDQLKVDRLLLHPLDRGELARHAAEALERQPASPSTPAAGSTASAGSSGAPAAHTHAAPLGPPSAVAVPRARVEAALAAVLERAHPQLVARLDAIERAIVATVEGTLAAAARRDAEAEAHRLAGSLGTFGSHDGTRLARQIEAVFGGAAPLARPDGARLAKLVASLRTEIDAMASGPAAAPPPSAPTAPGALTRRDPRPLLLAVGADTALVRALETEAPTRGMRVRAAVDATRARVSVANEAPDAVLVDLASDGDGADAALAELARHLPGVPLLVLTDRAALPDRVRLLEVGARLFLPKPAAPGDVLDALARVLPGRQGAGARVLAVDDDPHLLAALRALLEPQGFAVTTLEDPLRFWGALEEAAPDLLVLDVDMPHLSGIDLCRVVRADARWARLPVLFLTARSDRDSVLRVFAAGADDYVAKPLVGPELVARIRNRLERSVG